MIVALLGLLTFVKSAQGFAIIWIQLMVHYGDLEGAILLNLNGWWEHSHPLMVAGIGLYVQSFFLLPPLDDLQELARRVTHRDHIPIRRLCNFCRDVPHLR